MKNLSLSNWARAVTLVLAIGYVPTAASDASPSMAIVDAPNAASVTALPDGRTLVLGGVNSAGLVMGQARILDGTAGRGAVIRARLGTPRSGHTATVLPNGNVLVLGGVSANGRIAETIEIYDTEMQAFETAPYSGLLGRTDHSATVMTDGRILIAGGIGEDGRVLREVEVLNPRTGAVERLDPSLETARFGHIAALLPSSPVLIWGGLGEQDDALQSAELYDPARGGFVSIRPGEFEAAMQELSNARVAQVTGSIPASGAIDFPINGKLSVRFSMRLQMASLNERTVVLFGPLGVVPAKVVSAEGGMLVFITPETDLQPGAFYTLFLNGPADQTGDRLPFSTVDFRTAPIVDVGLGETSNRTASGIAGSNPIVAPTSPQSTLATDDPTRRKEAQDVEDDEEEWIPGPQNMNGDWRTHRKAPLLAKAGPPQAAQGVTALSGKVLRLNGKPLANVTLAIGSKRATTDENGHFLLSGLASGRQTLVIEGSTANRAGASYGYFESLVTVVDGRTNELPYVIWLPKLDTKHTLKIPSPTTQEIILSTPRIPGFEVRIPAGVVLRDRSGKIVTEIGITAVPIDRTPFPQPLMDFPVYYTVQPGGVMVQSIDGNRIRPAEIIYPNYTRAEPGTQTNAFLYDPFEKGWYVYGHGVVNRDGSRIIMDPGVGIYEFTGSAHSFGPNPGPPGPPCLPCGGSGGGGGGPDSSAGGGPSPGGASGVGSPDSDSAADPISVSTGVFIHTERDLTVTDVTLLSVLRVYRHNNPNRGMFGYGWSSPLDWYLWLPGDQSKIVLVLPNGTWVEYNLLVGSGYTDGIYKHTASPGEFYASTLQSAGATYWRLIFQDGREYNFDVHSPTRLVMFSDRFGNTTRISRDLAGNITRLTGPAGRWIAFTLNADGTVAQTTDAIGRTYSYTYSSGYLQTATDPQSGVRTYGYDASNRLRTVTDPRNNVVVTNDYDANGRVSMQTFANSATIQFAYTLDGSGKVTQTDVTDQRGNVRRINFDSKGFITSSIYPLGTSEQQATTFSRDATSGRVNSVTDQLGRVTTFTYDPSGNVLTVTRLSGTSNAATTTYTYEPYFNQIATITDPLNHTWTYGFDSSRNPTTLTDPLNHVTSRTFNSRGQITSITDALSHTWTYAYSGPDLATVTDPLSRATSYYTDAIGRVIFVKDALEQVPKWEYDGMDRVRKITDPLGGVVEFGFDAAGNLTSHKDQKTNTISYAFNNLNLVSTKTDALTNAETYLYGTNGKLSRITDRKSQVRGFTYDNRNRVSQVGFGATVANPTSYTSTISYTYDGGDRVTQITDSVGGTITRTYDGFDRLTQEQTPEGTVNYTYDAAGRRATMTVAGQSTITYTWDNANRLTQIAQGTDVVAFAYDHANRRTSTTLANGVVVSYGYNNANDLISITYAKGGNTLGDLSYTYDNSGRRIKVGGSFARVDLPAVIASAIYNANNQLTSWNGTAYSYDLNGNLSGNGTDTYVWNARNQLSGIFGSNTASFGYDGAGRRKNKTIGGTQTGFLYDGLNFVQELTGSTPKANLITGGIDEVFLRKETSATRHFLGDALGSVIALTDTAGAMQTQYNFEPYGKAVFSGSADTNSQSYTGREDDATGLFYYRARYYAPTVGRFIAEDLIGIDGGPNIYTYVGGHPTMITDPMGLDNPGMGSYGYTMRYKPGDSSIQPVPQLTPSILCLQTCLGMSLTITGGSEGTPYHAGDAHPQGRACDFGCNSNPGLCLLPRNQVSGCAKGCGFTHGKFHNPPHWHLSVGGEPQRRNFVPPL